MKKPELTLVIPSYNTLELTKICLRMVRKNTDLNRVEVIVVDNHSSDGSKEYLESVDFIRLYIRNPENENGPVMHSNALDFALTKVNSDLVMIMHTDTMLIHPGYADYLTGFFHDSKYENLGGVGSWKLEMVSPLKRLGKTLEDGIRRFFGKKTGHEKKFLRSHCAVYRTDLIRTKTRGFGDGKCAGESIHQMLEEEGYRMKFLSAGELGKYVRHLNHATMILNPSSGDRKTSKPKARKRLSNELDSFRYILDHPEYDRK